MNKIKIIHGENIVESRKALAKEVRKAKAEGMETTVLDGRKIDLTQVRSALESNSLFRQGKLVVLENFLSSPDSSFKRKILTYLKKGQFDNHLLLWDEKALKNITLKVPAKIFRLDPVLFRFLDSLKEGAKKENLNLLGEVKKKEKAEMIFFMVCRQIRLLILAKDLGEKGLGGMAFWQKNKFLSQAKSFRLDHLINLYRRLLEIDSEQKRSRDPFSLHSRLDLLVSEI